MSRSTLSSSFPSFRLALEASQDSPLHDQWRRDKSLRASVPKGNAWRGCLGLAMICGDAFNHPIDQGGRMLLANSLVRWAVLRDVPPHHFPGSPPMDRRGVDLATVTQAELRYGMPVIDFTKSARDSWDLRFMPFDSFRTAIGKDHLSAKARGDTLNTREHGTEFAAFNLVNAAMTDFAFRAVDGQGRPILPAWSKARPDPDAKPIRPKSTAGLFPVPYLAFDADRASELFWAATEAKTEGQVVPCSKCGEYVQVATFTRHPEMLRYRPFEDGDWVARCPACKQEHKWHVADKAPARVVRHFPDAFKDRFTADLAKGLPLYSVGHSVYCGTEKLTSAIRLRHLVDADSRNADLVGHVFMPAAGGERTRVYLPATANVTAKPGQTLEPGEQWCMVVPDVDKAQAKYHADDREPTQWLRMNRVDRWYSLETAFGGRGVLQAMQMAWFTGQAVRDEFVDGQILLPADLVIFALRTIQPEALWWDVVPCADLVDGDTNTAVLPPLRLDHWNQLRTTLPGDVWLDASIVDPRFDPGRAHEGRLNLPARQPTKATPKLAAKRSSEQLPKEPRQRRRVADMTSAPVKGDRKTTTDQVQFIRRELVALVGEDNTKLVFDRFPAGRLARAMQAAGDGLRERKEVVMRFVTEVSHAKLDQLERQRQQQSLPAPVVLAPPATVHVAIIQPEPPVPVTIVPASQAVPVIVTADETPVAPVPPVKKPRLGFFGKLLGGIVGLR